MNEMVQERHQAMEVKGKVLLCPDFQHTFLLPGWGGSRRNGEAGEGEGAGRRWVQLGMEAFI
jgi:hypothetical protein